MTRKMFHKWTFTRTSTRTFTRKMFTSRKLTMIFIVDNRHSMASTDNMHNFRAIRLARMKCHCTTTHIRSSRITMDIMVNRHHTISDWSCPMCISSHSKGLQCHHIPITLKLMHALHMFRLETWIQTIRWICQTSMQTTAWQWLTTIKWI